MPLSKARDRKRKKIERSKLRLDKLLLSPAERRLVQPKPNMYCTIPQTIDADGNPIFRRCFPHERLLAFLDDHGAEAFDQWWVEIGEQLFGQWLQGGGS